MVVGIIATNAWYCQNCQKTHSVLYVHGTKAKYCPLCVPSEVKSEAKYINQNREVVAYED